MYIQKKTYTWKWKHYATAIDFKAESQLSRGRDRMVVGFTTTYGISAYHH